MVDSIIWARVADKYAIAENTVALELVAEDGGELPPFDAGAYIEIDLGFGLPRQYSLANDPHERQRYLLGVLKAANSKGTSIALHDVVVPGTSLRISPPKNLFALDEAAPHTVLVGGGIGITPMLSFAHRLHCIERSFELHFCARSIANAPFAKTLETLPFFDRIHLHLDDDSSTALNPEQLFSQAPNGSQLYLCGPDGFMNYIEQHARQHLSGNQIHRESFTATEVESTPSNQLFEVEIKSSGQVISVGPDEVLVDVLQQHGLPVRRNCPRGFCGGCAVRVLEGTVDHRDRVLPDHMRNEMGAMLSCVSRGEGRLVLDL